MGNKVDTFTEEQLEDYQDCTFFTRKEILRVYKKFLSIGEDKLAKKSHESTSATISLASIENLAELKENPFRRRICEVFSSDGSGDQSFEEFLDMLSVFSEQATRDIKVYYAFKIYDFDGDNSIGSEDLCKGVNLLSHEELSPEEVSQVCDKAIEESDLDGDGALSFIEFQHVILRSPEFFSTFHIRI
ncbi:calcium and integrin binding family member 2 [Rhodnius prolixus]|uniref:EF-hand domain-containing protein n=1 Tax=Rhodnius prolixus TaxID=13249 RepID=T1HHK9_RHOPR